MSAFLLSDAHIDICVDAALCTQYATDPETGRDVRDLIGTEIGQRMIRANVASVIVRYGLEGQNGAESTEEDARAMCDGLAATYRHHRNRAVAKLEPTRKLGTYLQALRSLGYQSCEVRDWDAQPMAALLQAIQVDLTSQLIGITAVPGAWSWDSDDRGTLPTPCHN